MAPIYDPWVGAVIGELSAPFLRRWPVWPVMTGIVLGLVTVAVLVTHRRPHPSR
jgi:hypothetical protein